MEPSKKQITSKQDYLNLMTAFYEATGFIYFLDGRCRWPKSTNPSAILEEIQDVMSGFTNSWPDYTLMRNQLRAALAKIEQVKALRDSQNERDDPD